jgi:hypothetical protein
VIDTMSAFHNGDENDAALMREFFKGPRKLAELGATVVIIHHDGKAESSKDYRGSSDFKAAVDQAFHVTNLSPDPGRLDRINLRCFKSRFGFSGSVVYFYAGGRFIRDQRVDAPARTQADHLTALLRQNPGRTQRDFESLTLKAGIARSATRDFLDNGVLSGVIRRELGANRAFHYALIGGKDDAEI